MGARSSQHAHDWNLSMRASPGTVLQLVLSLNGAAGCAWRHCGVAMLRLFDPPCSGGRGMLEHCGGGATVALKRGAQD